ncbi:hypothetical protein [uncultured Clostridium sp.]|jgi:hypothetical protein|uniref:hypothetical protein n=1 Tax=uncultured Clostridium sp. TaxID=59620 RepID=UPI00204AAC1D|nr:hypothetical protein [uncultured Clostridium sp.]DAP98283.1 MAG TPA: hypothetical protein [Caudoviricetes sp.]
MTKLINNNKLNSFATKLWDKITNSFVSKTLPNNVIGETVFSDGHIEGATLNYFNNKNSQMYIGSGTGDCFGVPNNSVYAGVHVGRIALAVNPSLVVGSNVNSVVALAVKKRNNEVMEVITRDSQAKVYKNPYRSITADKIIYIDINKKFSEEVYFVIGCNGLIWNTDTPPNRANVYGSDTIPAVGNRLTITDYGYSGRFIIFTGKTSFEELVSQKNDSVSKTKDNILVGKTVLQDGYIDGELYSINNQSATDGAYTNLNTAYSGTANKIIPANKNVTSIIVAVRSSMNVGAMATGVNVGVVRADTNEIIEYVHQNATSTVYENSYPQIDASRVVNIPINKSWEQNVYFIIGVNGMLWYSPHGSLQLNKVTGGDNLPSVGHIINNLNRTNYIGKIVVLGEVVSLNTLKNKVDLSQVANEPNKIPIIGEDGRLPSSILPPEQNGGVRTVNSQSPVNGNVTVYSDNIDINSSTHKTIKTVLDEKVNTSEVGNDANKIPRLSNGKLVNSVLPDGLISKNNVNNFTNKNDFNFYSPTVTRDFTIATFNEVGSANRRYEVFNNNHYVVTVHNKFTETSKRVDSLIVPIANAQVGDTINATYFVINNGNVVIKAPEFQKPHTVEDIDMVGCKCIRIQVNQQFNQVVGFGFIVEPRTVRGNVRIGLAYATDNSYSNSVWSSAQTPHVNQSVAENKLPHKVFPYKVTHRTTSELVTRFELEKVTQMYPRTLIGEYKNISYDAGNTLDDGMNTWLKANGQTVTNTDYPELFEKLNPNRIIDDLENIQVETFELPNETAAAGYYYICAK